MQSQIARRIWNLCERQVVSRSLGGPAMVVIDRQLGDDRVYFDCDGDDVLIWTSDRETQKVLAWWQMVLLGTISPLEHGLVHLGAASSWWSARYIQAITLKGRLERERNESSFDVAGA